MITQAQIEAMLTDYIMKVAVKKGKKMIDVRLIFLPSLKNPGRFQVFEDELTKEAMVDIIPFLYKPFAGIIHRYVSNSIAGLAERNKIGMNQVNVIMYCDDVSLKLVLMNATTTVKYITVEELFEINTE